MLPCMTEKGSLTWFVFLLANQCASDIRCFPFNKKFRHFSNGAKWKGHLFGEFLKNPKIIEFPKIKPFSWKFQEKNQQEQHFPVTNFQTFGYTSRGYKSSFLRILENTAPFTTGNFQKFKEEFLIKWNAPRVKKESLNYSISHVPFLTYSLRQPSSFGPNVLHK